MEGSRQAISDHVRSFSNGLVATTSDLMLLSVYFQFQFGYDGGANVDERMAFESLANIKPSTLKRAFVHLKQKGMVDSSSDAVSGYVLTDEGRKYIDEMIPHYHEERNWDGRVYIITYDLPVSKNSDRNAFRNFLKDIRAGMLQHSVWVSVYNPTDQVRNYLEEKELNKELVIISSVGNDGYIGNMDFKQVANKVYGIDEINQDYRNFINMVNDGVTREWTIFMYLGILNKDPQVPFELQPEDWAGYEAYEKFKAVAQV